ncbi:MAG: RING finger domain-containing protein [Candidatus Hodarchaeota archaeon]
MNSKPMSLERLFYETVLPRYEELQEERYALKYDKTSRRDALAEIRKIPGQFNTPDYYLLTISSEIRAWDDDAKAALMAHELGHLLVWKGFLPSVGDIEESISLQSVGRGFGEGIRKVFKQFCNKPCWIIERSPNGEIFVKGASRRMGGITCSFKVLGSQYCPFSQKKPKITLLTHVNKSSVACAICASKIPKSALKCQNCQSQFHQKCVDLWLKQESSCPICKVVLIDEENA